MKKKVLITGASKGIGESIARNLAKLPELELFIIGRNEERLQKVAKEIGAKYIVTDLSEADACKNLIAQIVKIDILINNAGEYVWTPIEEVTDEQIERVLDLNLKTPYKLISLVTKEMKNSKWGRIINIGSISGAVGEANASLYSASKSGLIGMTKALALELAEHGITVNVINPGWVKTELVNDPNLNLEEEIDCVPQRRFIEPVEVAKMVEYLISDSAKGVTGQSLNLCAGLSLG